MKTSAPFFSFNPLSTQLRDYRDVKTYTIRTSYSSFGYLDTESNLEYPWVTRVWNASNPDQDDIAVAYSLSRDEAYRKHMEFVQQYSIS